jgi:hypothetical protein
LTLITPVRGRVFGLVALVTCCLALLAVPTLVAAAPSGPAADPEGGSQQLRDQLDSASRGFVEAKAKLAASQLRQRQLTADLGRIEAQVAEETTTVGELAEVAYRTGRLGPLTALLDSDSPDGFLDRAVTLSAVAANQDRQVRDLVRSRDAAAQAKAAVDREVTEQRRQLAIMQARKQQAEKALADAARQPDPPASGGGSSGGSSSGSLSGGCTVNDPTTSGCITPRMLNALQQAKAAGFTRFVSCYRSGGSGEHPKGRACDFSATTGGFGGVASGGDRTYGDNLANYFIRNADRLGVLYVIWFKRIWLPSSGWKAYTGGNGDPSSDHTNHVHLSVI